MSNQDSVRFHKSRLGQQRLEIRSSKQARKTFEVRSGLYWPSPNRATDRSVLVESLTEPQPSAVGTQVVQNICAAQTKLLEAVSMEPVLAFGMLLNFGPEAVLKAASPLKVVMVVDTSHDFEGITLKVLVANIKDPSWQLLASLDNPIHLVSNQSQIGKSHTTRVN